MEERKEYKNKDDNSEMEISEDKKEDLKSEAGWVFLENEDGDKTSQRDKVGDNKPEVKDNEDGNKNNEEDKVGDNKPEVRDNEDGDKTNEVDKVGDNKSKVDNEDNSEQNVKTVYIYYNEGDRSSYNVIFDTLEKMYSGSRDIDFSLKFKFVKFNENNLNMNAHPCFYIFTSTTFRLDGYNKNILNILAKCTDGNVIMVCLLKINNAVSANTKFSQDELEKMEINSGLNPNGGKKRAICSKNHFKI